MNQPTFNTKCNRWMLNGKFVKAPASNQLVPISPANQTAGLYTKTDLDRYVESALEAFATKRRELRSKLVFIAAWIVVPFGSVAAMVWS